MNRFAFTNCDTLEQALSALTPGAELKAGGTDVLDRMKERISAPEKLVNIRNIQALRGIEETSSGLRIGPLMTLAEVAEHPAIQKNYTALANAAAHAATPQIRNMGTIGGNLVQRPRCWYFRSADYDCRRKGGETCYAQIGDNEYHAIFHNSICAIVHPSSTAVPLMALGGSLDVASSDGKRTIPLEKFFLLPEQNWTRENILRPGEIITAINLPKPASSTRSAYQKWAEREGTDWAIADAGVVLDMDGDTCRKATIVVGAAAPAPLRMHEAEAVLAGKPVTEETARAAGKAAMGKASPLTRNAYKVPMFEVAIYRTIMLTAGKMGPDPSAVGGRA